MTDPGTSSTPPDPAPAALTYRDPRHDRRRVSSRDVFGIVRWSAYATVFTSLTGFCAYTLVTGRVEGGTWARIVLAAICAAFITLSGLCAFRIRRIWAGAARHRP